MAKAKQSARSADETPGASVTTEFTSKSFPLFGVASFIVTMTLCVSINRYYDHEIGGTYWPYISDTAKYAPERSIFAFGSTFTCMFMTLACILNYGKVKREIEMRPLLNGKADSTGSKRNMISLVSGAVGSPFLGLLACFDTKDNPMMHLVFVLIFFPLMLTFMFVTTSVYRVLLEKRRDSGLRVPLSLKYSHYSKWAFCCLMLFFVVLYLPVGMYFVTDWFDYSTNPGIHTFRAVNQHLAVACLVSFFGTFWFDFGRLNMQVVQTLKNSSKTE